MDDLLTRVELAKLLEVHPITVTKWEQAGLQPAERGRRGTASKYSAAAVRAWLQAREEAARTAGPLDPIQERALKDRADRLLKEQKHAVNEGRLVPADDVLKSWARMTLAAREKLLTIPSVAMQRGIIDTVDEEDQLTSLIDEALTELAGRGPSAST